MTGPVGQGDPHRVVLDWVRRLVDYGKGEADPALDDMTLGQIADEILAAAAPTLGNSADPAAAPQGSTCRCYTPQECYRLGHADLSNGAPTDPFTGAPTG